MNKLKRFKKFETNIEAIFGGKAGDCCNKPLCCERMCENATSNSDVWMTCINFCMDWNYCNDGIQHQ